VSRPITPTRVDCCCSRPALRSGVSGGVATGVSSVSGPVPQRRGVWPCSSGDLAQEIAARPRADRSPRPLALYGAGAGAALLAPVALFYICTHGLRESGAAHGWTFAGTALRVALVLSCSAAPPCSWEGMPRCGRSGVDEDVAAVGWPCSTD